MTYIEGFVTPVPTANKAAYRAHAEQAAAIFADYGLRRMVEAWGDDVPRGTTNDLWQAVDASDDEAVVFSWFEYPDKAARDAAIARMMDDPRMEELGRDMPFDGARMIYGGFDVVHEDGLVGATGYIDGVVMPVTAGREAYGAHAATLAAMFLRHGALRVLDAIGDDIPDGKRTDYNRAIHRQDGETPGYGWIEWPSKDVRDAGWKAIESDPAMARAGTPPFDGKRMMFSGFVPILDKEF